MAGSLKQGKGQKCQKKAKIFFKLQQERARKNYADVMGPSSWKHDCQPRVQKIVPATNEHNIRREENSLPR